jgi:ssDNA-binding Zn-finger/Zn-ribbon topoisomerase 1
LANNPDRRMQCPKCGGHDVRRSYSRNSIADNFMTMFGRRPFRCRFCECRFYRTAAIDAPEPETLAAQDGSAPKSE